MIGVVVGVLERRQIDVVGGVGIIIGVVIGGRHATEDVAGGGAGWRLERI